VPIEPFTSSKTIRIFSIPLAKTFLLLSALVYERKDNLVLAASRDVAASKRDDKSPNARDQLLESAQSKLSESEETIWLQVFSFPFFSLSRTFPTYRPLQPRIGRKMGIRVHRNLRAWREIWRTFRESILLKLTRSTLHRTRLQGNWSRQLL